MRQPEPAPVEDPLTILRERFARGEIDLREFETRVERLLRADPLESDRRPDRPAAVVSTRWAP
ncbi:MAG: SHOCT domain-containing protein [Acidimicrobiales bacterium]